MVPDGGCEMKGRGALRSSLPRGSARVPLSDECHCVQPFGPYFSCF